MPSPTPVHNATKKPHATTSREISNHVHQSASMTTGKLTHLVCRSNFCALMRLPSRTMSVTRPMTLVYILLHTLAISAPKTGATPVIVPTAKPTRRRPMITTRDMVRVIITFGGSRVPTHSDMGSTRHQSSADDAPYATKSDSSTSPEPIARYTNRSASKPSYIYH